MAVTVPAYTGRFAPSPTGPLHFGSLLAATASFLDARAHHGRWLLRIEDTDLQRCRPEHGAAEAILRILEAYGLHWDGPVIYQTARTGHYRDALDRLTAAGLTYACTCSRRDLARWDGHYPGHCRQRRQAPVGPHALRLRVPAGRLCFDDRIQGRQCLDLARESGDFIVLRRDGCIAYQLATAVDDSLQGITRVVRGSDLLDSTFRQRLLMQNLGITPPDYAHLPVAVNAQGQKLSKQSHAPGLRAEDALRQLSHALRCLGQALPDSPPDTPAQLLDWAARHWSLAAVPRRMQLPFCMPPAA